MIVDRMHLAQRIELRLARSPLWMRQAYQFARLGNDARGLSGLAMKRDGRVARLEIYDFIGYDPVTDTGISAAEVVTRLDEIEAADELHIHVNSPGGDVFDGIAIYNAIRRFSARSVTHVDGVAASAASVVALAADHVITSHGAMWMVHAPWAMIWAAGNADDLERAAAETVAMLRKISDDVADIYRDQTMASREDVLAWMQQDTWMSGAEALERGLTDELETLEQQEPVAAEVAASAPVDTITMSIDDARRDIARARSIAAVRIARASPG